MTKKYGSIVKLRRLKEEDVVLEMHRLRKRLRQEEQELEHLKSEVSRHDRSCARVLEQGARHSLHELQLHIEYLGHLAGVMDVQNDVVNGRKLEVHRKREELGRAAKERRIAETLQEKAWAETMADLRRKEQKEIDETATVRHTRQD